MDWILHGKGKLVIGGSKYMAELKKAQKFLKVFGVLNVYKNKVIRLDTDEVDKEQERIEAMSISQECIRRMKDRCDRVIINDRDIMELDNSLYSL